MGEGERDRKRDRRRVCVKESINGPIITTIRYNQILPGRCENVHPHTNTIRCMTRGPIFRLVWSVGNVRRCRYLSKIAATTPILRIQNVSHFLVSRIHFKDPSAKNEWPQVVVFVFVHFTPFFPENLRREGIVDASSYTKGKRGREVWETGLIQFLFI